MPTCRLSAVDYNCAQVVSDGFHPYAELICTKLQRKGELAVDLLDLLLDQSTSDDHLPVDGEGETGGQLVQYQLVIPTILTIAFATVITVQLLSHK